MEECGEGKPGLQVLEWMSWLPLGLSFPSCKEIISGSQGPLGGEGMGRTTLQVSTCANRRIWPISPVPLLWNPAKPDGRLLSM